MSPSPGTGERSADGPRDGAERTLALLLTTHWMLVTGRRLAGPPLLHHLDRGALEEFWCGG
ncbi:hypothetical protein GCM10022221_60920 [Actinocorallia aurea]